MTKLSDTVVSEDNLKLKKLDSIIGNLKNLDDLEEKLDSIETRLNAANKWLEKVPRLEERISEVDNKKMTIRAVTAEELQETTAYKIIKNSAPTILMLTILVLAGGIAFGGYQINSVSQTARDANKEIENIKDSFQSKLDDRFRESTSHLLSELEGKQEDATKILGRLEATEININNVAEKINKKDELINTKVDNKIDNRFQTYEPKLTKLENNLSTSSATLEAINQNKSLSEQTLGNIKRIHTQANERLQQQDQAIKSEISAQTTAYFDQKFDLKDIKNINDVKLGIKKIEGDLFNINRDLTGIEQRILFINKNYMTIAAIVLGALAFGFSLLNIFLLKKKKL